MIVNYIMLLFSVLMLVLMCDIMFVWWFIVELMVFLNWLLIVILSNVWRCCCWLSGVLLLFSVIVLNFFIMFWISVLSLLVFLIFFNVVLSFSVLCWVSFRDFIWFNEFFICCCLFFIFVWFVFLLKISLLVSCLKSL